MKSKIKIIMGLVLAGTLMLSACDNSNNGSFNPDNYQVSVPRVGLSYIKSPLNIPSIVEREAQILEQYYEPFNLGVTYFETQIGSEQIESLTDGRVHILNGIDAATVITAASKGTDIKIISIYNRAPESYYLFTEDDTIQTAADLAGKTIAGPEGTILQEMLIAYLATEGLTLSDVEFMPMSISEAQDALDWMEADCALLSGAEATQMIRYGFRIVTTGKDLIDATMVTATSADFYENNAVLVEFFLAGQRATLDTMAEQEEAVLQFTADSTGIKLSTIEDLYSKNDYSLAIRDSDIEAMEKTSRLLLESGIIENAVDIEGLILDIAPRGAETDE